VGVGVEIVSLALRMLLLGCACWLQINGLCACACGMFRCDLRRANRPQPRGRNGGWVEGGYSLVVCNRIRGLHLCAWRVMY
jgi:hypothetical protein